MERRWPGLWAQWERRQVVSVGWPYPAYRFDPGPRGKRERNWTEVQNRLREMSQGDMVVARLPGSRIGRIGEILRLAVTDSEWEPLIKSPEFRYGEQGRQVHVRWDFTIGPLQSEYACRLPEESRLSSGKARKTISRLSSSEFDGLRNALADKANWAPAFGHRFKIEEALSDFISTFPGKLEPGLTPLISQRIREVSVDEGRIDVLLQDGEGTPVVVECKQLGASVGNLKQLQRYRKAVKGILKQEPRGMLVFGGAPSVSPDVRREAEKLGIELVAHRVDVDFQRLF